MTPKQANNRTLSVVSTIVSITLVLFLFGLLGLFLANANKINQLLKENIEISIFFRDGVKEADAAYLKTKLENMKAVKQAKLVTKEEAKEFLMNEIGDDFVAIIGYNPLPYTIDLRLYSDWANADSLTNFSTQLEQLSSVRDVYYQHDIIKNIDRNVKVIGWLLFGFTFLFLIIAVALINSTIRLTMYSKRFLVKSMQLVGATRSFIRKPFIWQSIFNGILAALLADGILLFLLISSQSYVPELIIVKEPIIVVGLLSSVILLGFIISGISSFFAINRYLNLKLEELY